MNLKRQLIFGETFLWLAAAAFAGAQVSAPVQHVAVGNGDFAQASAITPTEIMVNGKAIGETTLIVWERGGNREFFNVTIRPSGVATADKLDGIRRELKAELPGENLHVSLEDGSVFLRGTVNDLTGSDRAVAIASAAGKVVNLLNVTVPPARPQILLKVMFASVDRTRSKQLGLNLFSTGFGNVIGGVSTGQFGNPNVTWTGNNDNLTTTTTLANELNLFAFLPGLDLGGTLVALENKGLVQVLSEPNVLAEDGRLGTLLAGGEYPYPVVQGSATGGSTVTILFKEFGIRLNFIPTITPRGTIHLQVAPEVSSLDFTNAVTISGFQIPAIDIRRVKTEVELAQGQSFAIGGLLDNRTTETLEKIPYISNLPLIGKFFQSISHTKSNTELIVIVTPEIVQAAPAGSIATPHYPKPFLPPNSNTPMHHPDTGIGTATALPAPATMPVEKLIQSMKPEQTLPGGDSSGGAGGGAYSGAGAGASTGASSGAGSSNQ